MTTPTLAALAAPEGEQASLGAALRKADSRAMKLYDYFRSSAAYRVRIALNSRASRPRADVRPPAQGRAARAGLSGAQSAGTRAGAGARRRHGADAVAGDHRIARRDASVAAVAAGRRGRARAGARDRAADRCDIHPLNNLRVLRYLIGTLGLAKSRRTPGTGTGSTSASRRWRSAVAGRQRRAFCHGDAPTLADICLVPQLANARRFDIDMSPYPTLMRIEAACNALPAFAAPRRAAAGRRMKEL